MVEIGIDPGVKTGYAEWEVGSNRLIVVETLTIHEAMERVKAHAIAKTVRRVTFEDARKRRYFGAADDRQARSGAGIREGVGSVKRDCSIWDDFLASLGVKYRALAPQAGATKWSAEHFARVTGWKGRTSEHGRDAAILVLC